MNVIIINSSKKKAFRKSKRIISAVIPSVTNRVSLADIPKRILIELIKNLKLATTRGTSIQIFFESKILGFRGFKCIQVGVEKNNLAEFVNSKSLIDKDLIINKIKTP